MNGHDLQPAHLGIHVSSDGHSMYAPMVATAVHGLRERQLECGYEVQELVETWKKDPVADGKSPASQLFFVNYSASAAAGDVWIHVGKWLQPEFFQRCKRWAKEQVYCILYQSDPWDVTASAGVCEIWEYTHGNFPKAPVVRTIIPGFLPLWKDGNDQQAENRSSEFDVRKLEWVFMGFLHKANRLQCWNHLRAMPELQHVTFTNHSKVWKEDSWKMLARKLSEWYIFLKRFVPVGPMVNSAAYNWTLSNLFKSHIASNLHITVSFEGSWFQLLPRKRNVIFLNLHQVCNQSLPQHRQRFRRLETVRISSVLSFGALMVSEPCNAADMELFKARVSATALISCARKNMNFKFKLSSNLGFFWDFLKFRFWKICFAMFCKSRWWLFCLSLGNIWCCVIYPS